MFLSELKTYQHKEKIMAASINDKLRQSTTSGTRPSPAVLTGTKGIGASSISVDSTTGWATETSTDFVIYTVDANNERVEGTQTEWIGIVNSSTTINNLTLKAGTDQEYAIGSKVIATPTAAWGDDLVEAVAAEHNQDGTHSDITATTVTADEFITAGATSGGWSTGIGTHSVGGGYNSGNRSFEIDTSTDLTGIVSEGMRYKVDRDTDANPVPTQCADLDAASSEYASKSSPTGIDGITSVFTAESWVKLESYATMGIISRLTGSDGWDFSLSASGTVIANGRTTSSSNDDVAESYQSIPLNKWTHIAVAFTMTTSGSTKIYIDGVSVPFSFDNGSDTTIGVPSHPLELGARFSAQTFDGKLADVRVWSDIRTETEIQDNMYGYPSDTTGLVAHFKLNGDFTDDSSNNNDLTASGGAVATDTDNPWNATEYGIITNVTASTIQVFCPEGYGIPNETLTAPFYSTQDTPFGFPRDNSLWQIVVLDKNNTNITAAGYSSLNTNISVPLGAWRISLKAYMSFNINANSRWTQYILSSDNSSVTDEELAIGIGGQDSGGASIRSSGYAEKTKNLTAVTVFTLGVINNGTSSGTSLYPNSYIPTTLVAECAYL